MAGSSVHRDRGLRVVLSVGLAVAIASCSSSRGVTAPATSAHVRPSSETRVTATTPARTPQEQATEAYRAMWSDFVSAARSSNPDDPRLSDHSSNAALTLIRKGLRSDHAKGIVTRGSLTLRPRALSLKPKHHPRQVRIRDCVDSSRWLTYNVDSGNHRTGGQAGRHRVEALVTRTDDGNGGGTGDGVWKVSAFFVEAVGTC